MRSGFRAGCGERIIGNPGEVFSGPRHELDRHHGPCPTAGYANGAVACLPSAGAFESPEDCAAYLAPKITEGVPFQSDVGAET